MYYTGDEVAALGPDEESVKLLGAALDWHVEHGSLLDWGATAKERIDTGEEVWLWRLRLSGGNRFLEFSEAWRWSIVARDVVEALPAALVEFKDEVAESRGSARRRQAEAENAWARLAKFGVSNVKGQGSLDVYYGDFVQWQGDELDSGAFASGVELGIRVMEDRFRHGAPARSADYSSQDISERWAETLAAMGTIVERVDQRAYEVADATGVRLMDQDQLEVFLDGGSTALVAQTLRNPVDREVLEHRLTELQASEEIHAWSSPEGAPDYVDIQCNEGGQTLRLSESEARYFVGAFSIASGLETDDWWTADAL